MPYDFSALSPADFEDLSRDLLQIEFGVRFESFTTGRDQGIDLRHSKCWKENWIVQCKHYASSGWAALLKQLRAEVTKVGLLAPKRYIVTTTVGLTPGNKDKIIELFYPWLQSTMDIFGADDIRNLLGRYPDIERSHFKLWLSSSAVLSHILNAATFARTDALASEINHQVRLYVSNDSFARALDILSKQHVCIIAGVPGIGKTFLARMLLLHHLQQGYKAYVLSADIDEADRLYDPTAHQFFYYDDFLGVAFDTAMAKNEDARLADFINRVSRAPNKRLVLTTREYILKRAVSKYERLHKSIEERLKCVVNLEDYTRILRGHILYNHLFFSSLPPSIVRQFCSLRSYQAVVDHPNFSPRLIEFAIRHAEFPHALGSDTLGTFMRRVLNEPATLWDHAFKAQLSAQAQTVLLSMLFLPAATAIEDLTAASHALEHRRVGRGLTGLDLTANLKQLDGTFVSIDSSGKQCSTVGYYSPAIADYLLGVVQESPAEMEAAMGGVVFFEQILAIWSATQVRNKIGSLRWPGLSSWIQSHTSVLLDTLKRTWRSASCHRQKRYVPGVGMEMARTPLRLEQRLLRILEIGALLGDEAIRSWSESEVKSIALSWNERNGDRASAAALLGQVEINAEARRAVREWSLEDIEDGPDFEAAIRLRDSAPDLVDEAFEETLSEQFDLFVQTQEQYILEEAGDAGAAEAALDEVLALARKLRMTPSWYEGSLRERIHELGEEPDDFSSDIARNAHLLPQSQGVPEGERLDALFESLEQAIAFLPDQEPG